MTTHQDLARENTAKNEQKSHAKLPPIDFVGIAFHSRLFWFFAGEIIFVCSKRCSQNHLHLFRLKIPNLIIICSGTLTPEIALNINFRILRFQSVPKNTSPYKEFPLFRVNSNVWSFTQQKQLAEIKYKANKCFFS